MVNVSTFKVVGAAFAALFATSLLLTQFIDSSSLEVSFINDAQAAESDEGGQGSQGSNKGGQGQKGSMGQQGSGGKKGASSVLEAGEDSDSDRPEWAGGSKELNPHRGDPNPTSGTKKGGDYGDLWIVVRDLTTGAPILVGGEYQVCVDPACAETILTVDGELPEGAIVSEVELGRANIVRSPDKVTLKALDEVISKLASGTLITTDLAGRLVIDGATVDSPLENLGLYIALMTSDPKLTADILAKLPGDILDVAAAALAGGADKTGEVTLDFLVYFNVITGVTDNDTFLTYGDFDYNRNSTYSGTITYFVQDSEGNVTSVTEPIMDAIFDGVSYTSSDGDGASDFTQAADDALKVIDFIHTQIHVAE